jgi:CheY-like chemotaxis protein/HPt (histidine-containing phosphotransfer) domain-containing protein
VVNQKVATKILAKLGYRADVAANGIEVLDALSRQPYDVVLMDVQMPELDGLGATRQIRRDLPPNRQPQIIAMTANAMQSDRELCIAAGMDDYISKPVRIEDLVAALEHVEMGRQAQVSASSDLSSVIDHTVLEQLQATLGAENPMIVVEIIDLFLEDLSLQIAALEQGLRDGVGLTVQRAAHTIKASATIVGAYRLARASEVIEDLARMGDLPVVKAQLPDLNVISTTVSAALQTLRPAFRHGSI